VKAFIHALILSLFAVPAVAQFTTVTGTVIDPHSVPYAFGTISAILVSSASPTLNGQPYSPPTQPVGLDKNGSFSFNVADNTQLQPAGTKWNFTVCSATGTVQPAVGTGSQCFSLAAPLTISGATQSISTQLNAVAPALTIPIGTGSAGTISPGVFPQQAIYTAATTVGPQNKPIYDVRDWATCDGVADSTGTGPQGGVKALLNAIGSQEATIYWIGSSTPTAHCRLENTIFPANITHDFSGGGAIEMISSTTVPGNAVFVNGTSAECNGGGGGLLCNTANATNGSTTLSLTAGNTAVVSVQPYPGFTFKISTVTDDCGDIFYHVQQSLAGQPRNVGLWLASNLTGGTCTITANANGATTHIQVLVNQFSGMGPVVSPDGQGSCTNADTTTMTSGAAATTAGSLLFGYGGQPFTAETCTAGAGFTQAAGLAGQSTNGFACAEYQLSSAGGNVTANQTITSIPTGSWVYCMQPLKVGNATATILGGIINPDLHQIFFNAIGTATTGAIDFTNNSVGFAVQPEWWGAGLNATPTVNTAALQAAIWAAFGGGPSAIRTNGSGLNVFNKTLYFSSNYSINNELQFYHVISFKIVCSSRLNAGITQTASNKRILDGQSDAYGAIYDCGWTGSASSTLPLIDLDFNNTQGNDLRPQFIDFYNNSFSGSGVTAVGLLIAKSGGGAQGSNIYCYDCTGNGFTTAAWQIGTPAAPANNALAIGWYGGDIQGCPQYGIANYGGGFITIYGTSFENGFTSQTGFDVLSSVAQGPIILEYVRSESRRMVAASNLVMRESGNANQALTWQPGASAPVGFIYRGNFVTGDGAYYQVTTDSGGFIGAGTEAAPILASSGTTTSITDTNQTIAGSNTIKIFTINETITQAVTGSTATLLVQPANLATVTGTNGATPITLGETFTQSVTGVTATQVSPTPGINSNSPLFLTNLSGTADSTHIWTGGTSGAVYTPNAAPTFSATTMLVTAATGAPDNSHNWTGNTSGAVFVPTGAPTNTANFTVNAFVGYLVGFLSGTSANCYGVVTANTAQTITFAGGMITKYQFNPCPAPDNTTAFTVEPNWNQGTISSGGMVLQYMNERVIDGDPASGAGVVAGRIENVGVSGDQVALSAAGSDTVVVENLQTTRSDWWCCISAGGPPQNGTIQSHKWDVKALLTGSRVPITWSYPNSGGTPQVNSTVQEDWGNRVLTWMTGNIGIPGTNVSALPTCIGGRSDRNSGNDPTRTVLEFCGMLGRPVPFGTNLSGTDTDITGGPSTGNANGGAINFWTSNPAGSSATPNSGLKRWSIGAGGGGNLLAGLDNTYSIGAPGANRPQNITVSNSLNVEDPGTFGSRTTNTSASCETSYGTTTLSTVATTTDTGLNCLPANAIIDSVVYRITTTITTAASFTIGDATTAARFCSTQSTLMAGTTGICFVQADQTGAPGPRQTSAAKVRVTTNVNPGAGVIRLIVYYHTWTAPTS
jgi:hypothetical protein